MPSPLKDLLVTVYKPFHPLFKRLGINTKGVYEFLYWWFRKRREGGKLASGNYEQIYTEMLGVEKSFYASKKILDVGCGPRGSLEWADEAAERIGLDPLVDRYRELGIDRHKMTYVNAPSERIPFGDGYFDVVLSLNSLDHVDNIDQTAHEICRVTGVGGYFFVMVEIHPHPTIAEPITLDWGFLEKFRPAMQVVEEHHYESNPEMAGVRGAMMTKIPFDHANRQERSGVLVAKLQKLK
jgi:SAM-dependent methyltransferase